MQFAFSSINSTWRPGAVIILSDSQISEKPPTPGDTFYLDMAMTTVGGKFVEVSRDRMRVSLMDGNVYRLTKIDGAQWRVGGV